MSRPNQKTYRIERISAAPELESLRGPWETLLARARPLRAQTPVFLTWEWVAAWCRHLEPDWEPMVLAAWNDAGQLAGIAPWMLVRNRYGPLVVRRLAFMGSQYAYRSHQDILALPEETQAVLGALMDYLMSERKTTGRWDVLDLEGLAESSPLKAYLAQAGGYYVEKESIECPYAPLPDSWSAYEMQQLSANRRQQIRARRRHLERDFPGQVRFETVRNAAELPEAMAAMIELHRKRWHGRGQASSFDVPSFLAFHQDVAAVALECGWLRLYILWLGDRPIAAEYCFLYNGVLFDYQKAIDPDPALERYSPGQLVQAYALQEAIAEGAREFDMARGTYDYKFSWTSASRMDWHVVRSVTPLGHAWLLGSRVLAGAKTRSRQILPESTRQRINQMLSGRSEKTAAKATDVDGSPGT